MGGGGLAVVMDRQTNSHFLSPSLQPSSPLKPTPWHQWPGLARGGEEVARVGVGLDMGGRGLSGGRGVTRGGQGGGWSTEGVEGLEVQGQVGARLYGRAGARGGLLPAQWEREV